MKILNAFLITGLMIAGLSLRAQDNGNAAKLLDMEQYEKAKSVLKADLKTMNSAESWYYLGKIYARQYNADSANYCFSRLAAADPKSRLIMVGQAISENLAGRNQEAMLLLQKARKEAALAKETKILIEVAENMVMAGDTCVWTDVLTSALSIDKKSVESYNVAGKMYLILAGKYNYPIYFGKASGRFEQALYIQPDNVEALTGLADIYFGTRNYEAAEEKYSLALAKDPLYIPALKGAGELYYTLGKYDKAGEMYGKYIGLAEYSRKDMARYISILYFNKEYSRAYELINTLLPGEPENPVLLRLKGYTAYELNRDAEGLEAMKKFFEVRSVVDTNKVIFTDYENYGRLLARTGNDTLAVSNLAKAFEMDTTQYDLLEDVAKLYDKQKNYPASINYLEKFIEAKKGKVQSSVYFNLGKDYQLLANQFSGTSDSASRKPYLIKADSAFSRVVVISPNSYLGYQWRARVLSGLDPETIQGLAKSDYEKTIAILELKNDRQKYSTDLIEAYRYMGYYYYLQFEEAKTAKDDTLKETAKTNSRSYWLKVLELDPKNDVATKAISALK